jgi:hypothetical protein
MFSEFFVIFITLFCFWVQVCVEMVPKGSGQPFWFKKLLVISAVPCYLGGHICTL